MQSGKCPRGDFCDMAHSVFGEWRLVEFEVSTSGVPQLVAAAAAARGCNTATLCFASLSSLCMLLYSCFSPSAAAMWHTTVLD
jgi:hypothetical protein